LPGTKGPGSPVSLSKHDSTEWRQSATVPELVNL
jgi:hypothetical protein